jgi:molybdenum cofactor cytidylyltransferase
MRRGHPWLIRRTLWDELIKSEPPQTMRKFLATHEDRIVYVLVESDSILRDIDTPLDYAKERPANDQGVCS